VTISRTVNFDDITPEELAALFAEMDGEQQAEFFDRLHALTKQWPGAGWCQQCCAISEHLTPQAQEIIAKLAEWSAEPYERPAA
jgi:hypothetical protein